MSVSIKYIKSYRRRGGTYYYYRRKGFEVRLRGEPGGADFLAAYQAAEAGYAEKNGAQGNPASDAVKSGSFKALWRDYEKSPEYRQIATETQREYRRVLEKVVAMYGDRPVAGMTTAWVLSIRDAYELPSRANKFIATLKLVISWGMRRGYVPNGGINPALGIKPLRTGDGHRIWTDEEYLQITTSPEAASILAPILVARYTSQRLGDVLDLRWGKVGVDSIEFLQRKNRHRDKAPLHIPIHPDLRKLLDDARAEQGDVKADDHVLRRPDGEPWGESHFKHQFTKIRRKIGLADDMHFHGIRGTAATHIADKGGSVHQIQSMTGQSAKMVEHYTRQAEQKRLAKEAVKLIK